METLFSVITPSGGKRPLALQKAVVSLEEAARLAGLDQGQVEWLLGFDGLKGARPQTSLPVKFVDFPKSGAEFGNLIRDRLIRIAKGGHLLFLDDDNAYAPQALALFLPHLGHEMVIGRVEVGRAFDQAVMPLPGEPLEKAVRQGNIDPLCLCLAKDLVTRCGGWSGQGGYESDFLNIRRYHRRARSVILLDQVVGVYDAGAGLDPDGLNLRQKRRQGLAPRD